MLHTQARDGLFFRIKIWPPKDSDQKYGPARKKTTGYHLFRNVLPGCNPILGSQLTAEATQLFSRDVRKRPAYVLCFSTRTIALRATHTHSRVGGICAIVAPALVTNCQGFP